MPIHQVKKYNKRLMLSWQKKRTNRKPSGVVSQYCIRYTFCGARSLARSHIIHSGSPLLTKRLQHYGFKYHQLLSLLEVGLKFDRQSLHNNCNESMISPNSWVEMTKAETREAITLVNLSAWSCLDRANSEKWPRRRGVARPYTLGNRGQWVAGKVTHGKEHEKKKTKKTKREGEGKKTKKLDTILDRESP